ncbi:hypothetical protein HJFPF1_09437 [Paramyrothecium foliicola]|nr:hypothetical protein HJFPF1_09437 [Paramyrothecium foliicola]
MQGKRAGKPTRPEKVPLEAIGTFIRGSSLAPKVASARFNRTSSDRPDRQLPTASSDAHLVEKYPRSYSFDSGSNLLRRAGWNIRAWVLLVGNAAAAPRSA